MPKELNHVRTYRELAQSVKMLLDRQGFPSKDHGISLHHIYDTILDMRTSYVKRQKVSRQGIGQQNIQTIGCVKLIQADTNICPCQPPTGCIWQRSKYPIPKSIFLTSVTNSNAAFKADYVEWSQFKTKIYSRSNSTETRYYTFLDSGEGSYLYLYNDEFLDNVSLTGLWENPNHAAYYTSCKKETKRQEFLRCNPLDTNLYMDSDITSVIFQLTVDFYLKARSQSLPDRKNDSSDDISGTNETV